MKLLLPPFFAIMMPCDFESLSEYFKHSTVQASPRIKLSVRMKRARWRFPSSGDGLPVTIWVSHPSVENSATGVATTGVAID